MKTLFSLCVSVFVLCFCTVCWAVQEPVEEVLFTLHDQEMGISIELAIPPRDHPWCRVVYLYENKKYDYQAWIPTGTKKVVRINEEGFVLENEDGSRRFRVAAGLAKYVKGGLYGSFFQAVKERPDLTDARFFNGDSNKEGFVAPHWVISWNEGERKHYRKFELYNGYWFDLEFTYNQNSTNDTLYEVMNEVVEIILDNSGFASRK